MKVAFIHYHLKGGGVTTVLRQQLQALTATCETLVLAGEPPPAPFPFEFTVIQGLGYDHTFPESLSAREVAAAIVSAIYEKWPDGCDILHIHNPLLAKNRMFPDIIESVRARIPNLFLQIHDFAEDGRPESYYANAPYPFDCHYGVINTRDYRILLDAGLSERGLHLVPNAVTPIDTIEDRTPKASDTILYPVRAIRRKNIGEAVLFAQLFPSPMELKITQPPNSIPDISACDGWKGFIREHALPVIFEAGVMEKFPELVAESGLLTTSSISEGFGFAFLEPWTAGKMLCGRKLPDICRDFETNGVHLNHLYTELRVPLNWIKTDEYRHVWQEAIRSAGRIYGLSLSWTSISSAWRELTSKATIDFGLLDEKEQKSAILHILEEKGRNRKTLFELNPMLKNTQNAVGHSAMIESNRKAVGEAYSETIMKNCLLSVYEKVKHTRIRQKIDKTKVLSRFFDIRRFSLLKWGNYRG